MTDAEKLVEVVGVDAEERHSFHYRHLSLLRFLQNAVVEVLWLQSYLVDVATALH